jgi:FdrA protein
MPSGFVIRKNQYYDSVFLMSVNKRLSQHQGVLQTAVLMATERNKTLLFDIGIQDPQIDNAQPNDLIVAVVAQTHQFVDTVLGNLDEALAAMDSVPSDMVIRTFEEGLAQEPNANLAVISIPGEYAAREALKALEANLNIFLFSSNVTKKEELDLKRLAAQKNLIVMGPDCGTSLIGGIGLGFANNVRRGSIGVVGASGTGLQEFTCLVHNSGLGISHAIGTGSNDLSDEIGGITTFAALEMLESDSQTEVIVIVSKPPGDKSLSKLINYLNLCTKPSVACFFGKSVEVKNNIPTQIVETIDKASSLAIDFTGSKLGSLRVKLTPDELELAARIRNELSPEQRFLRGLFAGGTFCYQSQQIFHEAGIPVYSNAPFESRYKLKHPDQSYEHTMVDMGDEFYTLGRPHPMIDGTMRNKRILAESKDPHQAILLLDYILGYNASMDPVGESLEAILEARQIAEQRGSSLAVVASICGTNNDLQDLDMQTKLLKDAGAIVFNTNAKAALFCSELLNYM